VASIRSAAGAQLLAAEPGGEHGSQFAVLVADPGRVGDAVVWLGAGPL
jgi:hypothetical protein